MVFRLLLGTTLRLLKLMNSGEMSSNCRLFFIFLQSFSTKIFKAVFPQLLCNTSNHRSEEYAENAPNKYYCHRPSARKYETGASFTSNQMKTQTRLCIRSVVFGPESRSGGPLEVYTQPREPTYAATQWAKQVSRENTSFCKLTMKTLPHMWTAVFLNLTQNSGNCTAAKAKRRASQRFGLSSWAWKWWPEARTRYARYHIRFHRQPLRPDDTCWASVSRALNVNQHPFQCISYELQPTPRVFPLAA